MVYGFYNRPQKVFFKSIRVSSTVKILNKEKLDIEDNVWVWHHSIVDASNGVRIGRGTQIGAWVGIFTHSSHVSIRLMGEDYIKCNERIGYISGEVEIGRYVFIGAGAVILPNVKIGDGAIVSAGAVVNKDISAGSIVSGNPARVIGNIIKIDSRFFDNKIVKESYFDKQLLNEYQGKTNHD